MSQQSELLEHYRQLHNTRVYGTSSVKYVRFLRPWIRLSGARSLLDYGCGQSRFLDSLGLGPKVALRRYDPAIADYARLPKGKVDLLVSIDVLEHIEEAQLSAVFREMRNACREALIVVDTKSAKHTLPDGRNAHVSLHSHEWWQMRLATEFGYLEPISTPRRSRAAFKTWRSTPGEQLAYKLLRAQENAIYYAKRLLGRHKAQWKVSSIAQAADQRNLRPIGRR